MESSSPLDSQVSYESIDLGSDFKRLFPNGSNSMIIREEYPRILKHIEDLRDRAERGVVVTGQPGIGEEFITRGEYDLTLIALGKSTFLFYVLISRILLAQKTAFQWSSSRTFFFNDRHDVRTFTQMDRIDPVGHPEMWALSDSNADVVTPRAEFTDARSQFFVVQATSPQPTRWKTWSKQLGANLAVMNPWSWQEIYIGA